MLYVFLLLIQFEIFSHEMSLDSPLEWLTYKLRLGSHSLRTGSMAQNKSCLNHRREKCYSAKPFPLWHPWCISNREQGPTSHPSPTQRCLQFLIPVIEDMCYSANSPDGKWLMVPPLWSLGNEREEGGRKEATEHFYFLMLATLND